MAATYVNSILQSEVSIALEHILVAPSGTAIPRTRVNVSSPPAGYVHLGSVQDDSPNLVINKGKYQLRTGIPAVIAYEAVVALSGELSIVMHANSNLKAHFGLGGPRPLNQPITAHSATAPTVTATTITRQLVSVNTTAGFTRSMLVATDTAGNMPTTYNVAYISSVNSTDGQLLLEGDGFHFLPTVGHVLVGLDRTELAFGTKLIPYLSILGVADFLNNGQVVHAFERATPRGQWQERLIGTQHAMVMGSWDLEGYTSTRYTGTEELIIGERLVYSANTIQ